MSDVITTDAMLSDQYNLLLASIDKALQRGRDQVAYAVSNTILQTYWEGPGDGGNL